MIKAEALNGFACCLPVYNEAKVIAITLTELAQTLETLAIGGEFHVVLVDDSSVDGCMDLARKAWADLPATERPMFLHVVTLGKNQGHQRALLAGLRYVAQLPVAACAVLDADGQDDPGAFGPMLVALQKYDVVFARRSKRAEAFVWVMAYRAYQGLFKLLLGQTLAVGNFSMLRHDVVQQLAKQGDLTHMAATLMTWPFSRTEVDVARRPRSAGETKMSYARLLDYAVAAITASNELWIQFFSRLSLTMGFLSTLGMMLVIAIRLFTNLAISGWASVVTMLALVISFQSLGFLVVTATLRRVLLQVAPTPLPLAGPTESTARAVTPQNQRSAG